MAITLGDCVTAVRLKHPAYSSDNVPSRVLAEAYTALQRRLVMLAIQRRPTYLSQRFSVTLAFGSDNTPDQVGASSTGGLPGELDSGGVLQPGDQTSGIAPVYDLSDAVELASARVITAVNAGASTTTLTFQGSPGWTVDGFAGQYLQVTLGPGSGPASLRQIASNTANTVTVTGLYDTVPEANDSVARIIAAPATQTDQLGVMTALPAFGATAGYLIKIDSTGTAYVDLTSPVQTRFLTGIPLPANHKLLGATVIQSGATGNTSGTTNQVSTGIGLDDCLIVPYAQRHRPAAFPAVYVLGNELFLCGKSEMWSGLEGLDIRYSPIPPAFTATATTLSEYFLLPDTAFDALVAHGGVVAARYAQAKGIAVDLNDARNEVQVAEAAWLTRVGHTGGAERAQARRNR